MAELDADSFTIPLSRADEMARGEFITGMVVGSVGSVALIVAMAGLVLGWSIFLNKVFNWLSSSKAFRARLDAEQAAFSYLIFLAKIHEWLNNDAQYSYKMSAQLERIAKHRKEEVEMNFPRDGTPRRVRVALDQNKAV
jgi:hypothetical protein